MSTQKLAEAIAPNMAASAPRNRYKGSKVPDKVALHGLWMLNLLNLPESFGIFDPASHGQNLVPEKIPTLKKGRVWKF